MSKIEMPGASRRGAATTRYVAPNYGLSPSAPIPEIGGNADGGGSQSGCVTQTRSAAPAPIIEIAGPKAGEGEAGHHQSAPHGRHAGLAKPLSQIGVAADGGGGQAPSGTHAPVAAPAPISEIADPRAGEGEADHSRLGIHGTGVDLAAPIAEIREQWRRRQAWHRAEKALTLQAKALCRRLAEGGDKAEAERIYKAALGKGSHPLAEVALAAMFPLTEARDGIAKHRAAVEKRLVKLAKALPVAPWVEATRGVGLLSLAAIVGEAGDLEAYANPAKLWKRMGLAVMPDGSRQRRVGGIEGIDHGYNPARRSVMWNLGACIVKAGGPLKAVYDARKTHEAERVETKMHAHNRAQRFVEKRFLKLLWSEWRRGGDDHRLREPQRSTVVPAT